jgi:hypothetical protein
MLHLWISLKFVGSLQYVIDFIELIGSFFRNDISEWQRSFLCLVDWTFEDKGSDLDNSDDI